SRCELTASFHMYRSIITAIMLLVFMRKQRSVNKGKPVQI
nr:Yvgn And cofactor Nadph [Bacillus pacificus]